jgi:hypothetical protein
MLEPMKILAAAILLSLAAFADDDLKTTAKKAEQETNQALEKARQSGKKAAKKAEKAANDAAKALRQKVGTEK